MVGKLHSTIVLSHWIPYPSIFSSVLMFEKVMIPAEMSPTVDGSEIRLTTWNISNHVKHGINYLSTGAGFQPQTVGIQDFGLVDVFVFRPDPSSIGKGLDSYGHIFLRYVWMEFGSKKTRQMLPEQ